MVSRQKHTRTPINSEIKAMPTDLNCAEAPHNTNRLCDRKLIRMRFEMDGRKQQQLKQRNTKRKKV